MFTYTKSEIMKDIEKAKTNNYFEKLEKFYKKFPKTECGMCGLCCTDSPIVQYIEFIYVYDYFETNFSLDVKIDVVKNAIREHMYGLILKDQKCPFLNSNNKCIVYQRSPISCKRWGLQSREDNQYDVSVDYERNMEYKNFYSSKGINIPDEVINFSLPYCDKVTIINNPYKITDIDILNFISRDLFKLGNKFPMKNTNSLSLGGYLVYLLFGKKIFDDRIRLIKDYQDGNHNVVEEYIENINYKELLNN